MQFILSTVVDITETNARRGAEKKEVHQQANYNTVIQTIGLRVNITPISSESIVSNIDKLGFGSAIKGKQRYWKFTFETDYEDALTLDMLLSDFDLVPIITDLDETAKINNSIFRTNHPNDTNIVFEILNR
jgi:hypothetical protein